MLWVLVVWVVLSIILGLLTARFLQGCEDSATLKHVPGNADTDKPRDT